MNNYFTKGKEKILLIFITILLLAVIYVFTGLQIIWILVWLLIAYDINLSFLQLGIIFILSLSLDFLDITKFGINTISFSLAMLLQSAINYYLDTKKQDLTLIKILLIIATTITASLLTDLINKHHILTILPYLVNLIVTGFLSYCIIKLWTKTHST